MKTWTTLCAALTLVLTMINAAAAGPTTIALRYDAGLKKVGFPSPVLTVRLGDRDVRFLVDSGAGVHTFAAWYVRAAALTSTRDADVRAVDANANRIDVSILRDVRLRLRDGAALDIDEAVVTQFPPLFEKLRIAGLLSPQLLATQTQAAVLDLVKPELRFEPMEAALTRLHATIQNVGNMTAVCVQKDSPLTNRLYAIRTLIAGIPTSLTIDTGATTTSIRDGIAAARALRAKPGKGRDQMSVGGTPVRVFQSAPVDVDFGGGRRRLSIGVGRGATGCSSQGLLGMDALAGCRWIFGAAAFAMSCAK